MFKVTGHFKENTLYILYVDKAINTIEKNTLYFFAYLLLLVLLSSSITDADFMNWVNNYAIWKQYNLNWIVQLKTTTVPWSDRMGSVHKI